MSEFSKQVLLALIGVMQWIIAWDPAPTPEINIALTGLTDKLKKSGDELKDAENRVV